MFTGRDKGGCVATSGRKYPARRCERTKNVLRPLRALKNSTQMVAAKWEMACQHKTRHGFPAVKQCVTLRCILQLGAFEVSLATTEGVCNETVPASCTHVCCRAQVANTKTTVISIYQHDVLLCWEGFHGGFARLNWKPTRAEARQPNRHAWQDVRWKRLRTCWGGVKHTHRWAGSTNAMPAKRHWAGQTNTHKDGGINAPPF